VTPTAREAVRQVEMGLALTPDNALARSEPRLKVSHVPQNPKP